MCGLGIFVFLFKIHLSCFSGNFIPNLGSRFTDQSRIYPVFLKYFRLPYWEMSSYASFLVTLISRDYLRFSSKCKCPLPGWVIPDTLIFRNHHYCTEQFNFSPHGFPNNSRFSRKSCLRVSLNENRRSSKKNLFLDFRKNLCGP